ncbi:MAG: hypothetical protein FWC80_05080 [Firmicutes bacterium]|nr:hypothetical protein [Bacillota bacterium]
MDRSVSVIARSNRVVTKPSEMSSRPSKASGEISSNPANKLNMCEYSGG